MASVGLTTTKTAALAPAPLHSPILQRKCACGPTIAEGECAECSKKNAISLQRSAAGNQPAFGYDFSRIPVHSKTQPRLQAKLAVNTPGDVYEREADVVADKVMRMPSQPDPQVHRQRAAKRVVQRQGDSAVQTAPLTVDEVLRSPGRPLDDDTRAFMQPRFGHDFSTVRVHSGAAAEQSARDVSANAYTVGHHIVFDSGRFAPATHEGRLLLAHELTHVVQQSGADGNSGGQGVEQGSSSPVALTSSPVLARKEADKPPKIGPAATIPERRGDVERGYFSTTDRVTYGVRASGPGKEKGLFVDHLFDTQSEAEEYAKNLAATGAQAIRTNSALPYAWANDKPGGAPVTGNLVTHVYVMEVPAGTANIQGVVAPQDEHRNAPWLQKTWEGGGPQTVLSWVGAKKIVAAFDVAKPSQADPQPIPTPPDSVTAKQPVTTTAPAAAVAADDPRAAGRLYSPNLVQQYRSQELLYNYSQSALSKIEDDEAALKLNGKELSEEDKKRKELLSKQVAAARSQMMQARKDFEMLDNPAATPKELQEMFARRGIAIPVGPQSSATGAALTGPAAQAAKADYERRKANEKLYGSKADELLDPEDRLTRAERRTNKPLVDQQGSWNLDEKGLTKKGGTATTQTVIGPDGMPVTFTKEKSSATTLGLGTATHLTSDKDIAVSGDKSIVTDRQTSRAVDILKGEGTLSKASATEIKDDAGTTTKLSDKTTLTAGLGGVTRTKDDSKQVGDKLDSKSSTVGIARGPGQLGLTAGQTVKSGTMIGPPDAEKMDKGTEKTNKVTGGLVSDDKGIGLGSTASTDRKTLFGDGKSVSTTAAAGGRCQVLVREIERSEPPMFTIATTISFDLKLGADYSKEWEAKPEVQKDTGAKGNVSFGGGASIGAYATFKREQTAAEAKDYIEFVKANGRGGRLPEHMILATGASQGWEAAKQLWSVMKRSSLPQKKGDEIETNVEAGVEAKFGAGGGESRSGGLAVGGGGSANAKHQINVKRIMMPDGKIQITATVDDEREVAGSASVSMGAASGKVGMSSTSGEGRKIVFILDPKADPALAAKLASAIDDAVFPADLDKLAAQNPGAVSANTKKTVEGEGTSVGAAVGPASINLGGKEKLTSEITRDQQGKVIGTKFTGENQGGGTVGLGNVKVGDTKTETYVGEVDKAGHAKGELSETKKSSSLKKSILKAGSTITSDPLGTVMHPDKLIEEEVESKGTAIADPEIMSICYAALDPSKWGGKVGGHRHDDWVAAGRKIRQASKVRNGEIYDVNKNEVQQALAEWTKSDVEGRKEVLDTIIRPLGAVPGGKAFAFPDGTESLKGEWDALVVSDPLVATQAMKPKEALAEMQRVKGKLTSLYNGIQSARNKWQGVELQHAEMLGHINIRINEIEAKIREVARGIPAGPKADAAAPALAGAPAATPTVEDAQRERAVQKTEEVKGWLSTYNNNIGVMKEYSESVFEKLNKAEARLRESGLFVASMMSRIIEVQPQIKQAEDLLKIWDGLYWPTFHLYEQISPYLAIDKSRVEKLHPAGARGRWQQVYDLTRDTSMAGH